MVKKVIKATVMNKSTDNVKYSIDALDRSILNIVQKNNQLSHAKIGELVGLSTSAVRRRLANLRKSGQIVKDVSLLNTEQFGITLIVSVAFKEDSVNAYDTFDKQMQKLAHVKQSYHVSGTTDYIIIVQGPSLSWYEGWSKQHLLNNANLKRHDTSVVWSCKKFETAVVI